MIGGSVQQLLLLLAPLSPLLIALALMIGPTRRAGLALAPLAPAPAVLATFLVAPSSVLEVPWLFLGTHIGLDETSRAFLLLTSVLWFVAGIYARGYFPSISPRVPFLVFFLLAMAGNLGLIVAQDIVTFYSFFALMSLASYGLIVSERSSEALRAGRVYIALAILGELLLFAAITIAANESGSLRFPAIGLSVANAPSRNIIIALAASGFGIKAGALGLHFWLPVAHTVAPTPASAVLSGAMIKAGLLGWLRLVPVGTVLLPEWGVVAIVMGLAAAFYGALVGITQSDPKTVLAYSSISQMGLITSGFGLGLLEPAAWPAILSAVLFFAIHHGFVKGALFLGVGVAASNKVIGWQRILIMICLLLLSLSLAGAPFTSGALAKILLKEQVVAASWSWKTWMIAVLPWSSVATTLLMARFLWLVWSGAARGHKTLPREMWISWGALVLIALISAWFAPVKEATEIWSTYHVVDGLWPVMLGTILATMTAWAAKRPAGLLTPSIPPGDILVPIASIANFILRFVSQTIDRITAWRPTRVSSMWRYLAHNAARAVEAEAHLTRWEIAIVSFIVMGVLLYVLMVL